MSQAIGSHRELDRTLEAPSGLDVSRIFSGFILWSQESCFEHDHMMGQRGQDSSGDKASKKEEVPAHSTYPIST